MNILILSWRGPGHPHAGGAEISTHEHAKGWVKKGHKVTLITSSFAGGKPEEFIDGVKIIRRGSQFFWVHIYAFKWYLFDHHERFDLVVDEFHGMPFFTPLYIPIKKIAFIHEVTKEVWRLNPWKEPFNLLPYLIGGTLEPYVFKFFYSNIPFMTVSQSSKQDLINWGIDKTKITVVHNGLTTVKQKRVSKEKIKTLIFLGAISKDKGIEDALQVFSSIYEAERNWQMWIVGKADHKYLEKLKVLSSDLGIIDKVKFWGFVSEQKKFELLSRAHLAINTSIREGWGLVNIEANSVGLPVLAYDVSGSRDSVRDGKNGFLVSYGNYKQLASRAIEIMENGKLYRKISTQAIHWSKGFSWERAANRSLSLIKSIVKS